MKLYLMRHGQASSPNLDPRQGLSLAGTAEIEQLAQRLKHQAVCFSQVLHSEKDRARQTAEIMTAITSPEVTSRQRKGLKPNDDPRPLLAEIEHWQEDTLVVSHLPFVPTLLGLLVEGAGFMAMIPGTIVCLNRDEGKWQIEWVESP